MWPLEGIRVLELGRALTAPYCTMLLADVGAEVIKVEPPNGGDETRGWGPPFLKRDAGLGEESPEPERGESAYFLCLNRNKKSLTCDVRPPEGQEIIRRLAARCDILVENFRHGYLAKLGLGYEHLRKLNGRLIYCSISGFGQTGPYRDKLAYDLTLQGMGGLMGITGEEGRAPVRIGVAIADIGAAMFAAIGILLALWVREQTGRGQYVDTSLLEGQVAWLTYMAAYYFATGQVPKRIGSAHPTIVPYQAFRCADGKFITVAAANEKLWRALCGVLELPITDDPSFATNALRVNNRDHLIPLLEQRFAEKPSSEWLARLEAAGVPCGPVYDLAEVLADPQVQHRGMVQTMEHPLAGVIRQIGIPIKLSETPGALRLPPPLLGQHTDELLRWLGYQDAELSTLREKGVID